MITINGSFGEGGGQILRTSLSLSLITGKPFRIHDIRAGRKKPGLLRQHLTCVNAAATIGEAQCKGNYLGSGQLEFIPKATKAGSYHFAVGSAGSSTLVFQTIFPALLFAEQRSQIRVEGGTHNSMAPSYDFLVKSYLPLLKKMGVECSLTLDKYGFYPAGGGEFHGTIIPVKKLKPLSLDSRGELRKKEIIALVANLPVAIAQDEIRKATSSLNWPVSTGQFQHVQSQGPGNAIWTDLDYKNIRALITQFGQKGLPAKTVVNQMLKEVEQYLNSEATVCQHLADQLLLPLSLAGKSHFSTVEITEHCRTNINVIGYFLDQQISTAKKSENNYLIEIKGDSYEMG